MRWGEIRTGDELCDASADERDTFAVRVGSDGTNLRLKLLSASNDIAGPLVLYNVNQGRVLHQSGDLKGIKRTAWLGHMFREYAI